MTTNKKNMIITGVLVVVMGIGCLNYYLGKNNNKSAKDPLINKDFQMAEENNETLGNETLPVMNNENEESNEDQTNGEGDTTEVFFSGKNNYFLDYRFEREETRASEMNAINELINSTETSKEVKTKAEAKIFDIADNMEKELHIEGLIKAKGYEDAVVMIGEETISAVIKKKTLTQEDMTIILDILTKETSIEAQYISIIPHN